MALNGSLQIILIVAVACLGLYFLQNMSGISNGSNKMFAQMHGPVENYSGQNIDPSQYDVPPNQELATQHNMPGQCGMTSPPPMQCNQGNPERPPTCPDPIVDQCGGYQDDMQDTAQASCFPRAQLTPEELLPSDECNAWSKSNPYGSGSLADRNFLQAGWATGVSSVGSTLRNANLQLRSDPPNPQVKVSPWMESTISPDYGRKPLELGSCS
jgi:hypothetical protein